VKKVRFYKEEGIWYIDLPTYLELGGHKSHLAMVAGADILLDIIDTDKDEVVYLEVGDYVGFLSSSKDVEYDSLLKLKEPIHSSMGCTYHLGLINKYYHSLINRHETDYVWLCPTTLYVFNNKYPDIIYFRKISQTDYEQGENTLT